MLGLDRVPIVVAAVVAVCVCGVGFPQQLPPQVLQDLVFTGLPCLNDNQRNLFWIFVKQKICLKRSDKNLGQLKKW